MMRSDLKNKDNSKEAVDENLNLVKDSGVDKFGRMSEITGATCITSTNATPDINKDSVRSRCGIHLLPSLLTFAGLFAGFFAIIAAIKGDFESAVIAIFIAMIMDFFDGRVARMTNSQTAFGGELDSLADIVSFGVAPALITFIRSLVYLHQLGLITAFLYLAAGALRLARFNTKGDTIDKHYFQGLPIPAAAGLLASAIWVSVQPSDHLLFQFITVGMMAFLTVLTGILMVSSVRYHSLKLLNFNGRTILLVVLIFACVSLDPSSILFLIFFSYTLSGPIFNLWTLLHNK